MQHEQYAGPMLIGLKKVLGLTSLSKSSIWRMVRAGKFPPPLRLSERRRGWRLDDVTAWIEGREIAVSPVGAP